MGKPHREHEATKILQHGQANYTKQIVGNLKPETKKFISKKAKAL